ncbi:hypothetical protein [Anatilimnocola floriformis]|uniref:hypothetical protein n=1 Tax=Anatilimnocola floriformis TaxID=2948575 RepID=UPI0020C2D622|nr:hypothetical protein [Anatilimnocola floriformis]
MILHKFLELLALARADVLHIGRGLQNGFMRVNLLREGRLDGRGRGVCFDREAVRNNPKLHGERLALYAAAVCGEMKPPAKFEINLQAVADYLTFANAPTLVARITGDTHLRLTLARGAIDYQLELSLEEVSRAPEDRLGHAFNSHQRRTFEEHSARALAAPTKLLGGPADGKIIENCHRPVVHIWFFDDEDLPPGVLSAKGKSICYERKWFRIPGGMMYPFYVAPGITESMATTLAVAEVNSREAA